MNGADWEVGSTTQRQGTILVVDDDAAMLTSLRVLFSANGFVTEAALGGRPALDLLGTRKYDVMLLDLQMPEVSGHDVLRYLKEKSLDIKVIVVSGESSFDAVREALIEGAYDFVRKPYAAGELLTTVGNALARRTLERQHHEMEQALQESERLHRYIVNNSPDFIYVLDANGHFTFVNDRAEDLLGYSRDQLVGQHFSVLIHEEDLREAQYVFCERRTGKRASRDIEVRLKVNSEAKMSRHFETYTIPISLHSVGMYNPGGGNGKPQFIGTYGCGRDITERKRTEELITYQAYHDLLTSLPNRALFQDRLTQALAHAKRYRQSLAVMYLDLDRFKLVNDSLGHIIGDKLLKVVAERILSCLREEDTLARFGGDEFTLLLPHIAHENAAAVVADKILRAIREPIIIDGHEIFTSTSIGIAIFPDAGETFETLLKSADIGMYHCKANGKDGFEFFRDEMNNAYSCHLAMERDLHRALEQNQFEIFFQPKVHSGTFRIVGMEALIRWRHPQRGLVYPGEFIPRAEETKLIVPIGDWVFRAACREVSRWRQSGLPKIKVSVNISAVQIAQENFIHKILDTMEEYGVDGSFFEVEITEHGLVKNSKNITDKLQLLHSFGMTIAIDDFGTGYSSLSYLHQFPIHTLKIDRSFVQDIQVDGRDTCIVDAIASMAKGLNLHMVAEGVETVSQLNYLKHLGCLEVQGFLFGLPCSADETLKLLTASPGLKLSLKQRSQKDAKIGPAVSRPKGIESILPEPLAPEVEDEAPRSLSFPR
jgi:diguanylate cyclase